MIGLVLFLAVILGLLAWQLEGDQRLRRDENLSMEVLSRAELVACIGLQFPFSASNEYKQATWCCGPWAGDARDREGARDDPARAR